MTTTKRRKPHPVPPAALSFEDDGDDTTTLEETAAMDPLAAEPLTTDEIHALEMHPPALEEDEERTLRVIGHGTEATMPFDVDDADGIEEATDQVLGVRLRPKKRR